MKKEVIEGSNIPKGKGYAYEYLVGEYHPNPTRREFLRFLAERFLVHSAGYLKTAIIRAWEKARRG